MKPGFMWAYLPEYFSGTCRLLLQSAQLSSSASTMLAGIILMDTSQASEFQTTVLPFRLQYCGYLTYKNPV
jgi:hypothetical protein